MSRAGIVVAEGARQLPPDDVILFAGFALGELLADAQDRAQAGIDRPAELAADERIGLAGVAPPFGVADDDPRREPGQHRCRDLAGVGALEFVVDVLGADRDVRIELRERVADRGETDERRADHPDHARHPGPRRDRRAPGRPRRPGSCASSSCRPR